MMLRIEAINGMISSESRRCHEEEIQERVNLPLLTHRSGENIARVNLPLLTHQSFVGKTYLCQ